MEDERISLHAAAVSTLVYDGVDVTRAYTARRKSSDTTLDGKFRHKLDKGVCRSLSAHQRTKLGKSPEQFIGPLPAEHLRPALLQRGYIG